MANPAATLPRHTFPEHAITLVRGRPAAGVEGLVAKGAQSHYVPGGRGWVKVKSRHTREAIIGAVIGPISDPGPSCAVCAATMS